MRVVVFAVWITAAVSASADNAAYRETLNIVYGEAGGAALVMDVFMPAQADGPAKGLGIVCITSGGWNSDRAMVEAHRKFGVFDVLCAHGYVVFAVRPGSVPQFTGTEMLDHVRRGIRYVKAHAADYAVDPDRLGLFGVSSGGHLACLAATDAEPPAPDSADPLSRFDSGVRAVAVFCPATDFRNWAGHPIIADLAKGHLVFRDVPTSPAGEALATAQAAISPVCHVRPGLPPFWIAHGDADSVIPFAQSEAFVGALHDAGVDVEFLRRPGGDHAWPTMRDDLESAAVWLQAKVRPQQP